MKKFKTRVEPTKYEEGFFSTSNIKQYVWYMANDLIGQRVGVHNKEQ
jgi:hypothetical protein